MERWSSSRLLLRCGSASLSLEVRKTTVNVDEVQETLVDDN